MGRTAIAVVVVLLVGLACALPRLTGPVNWSGTDALFYQAQSLELRGHSEAQARALVMAGDPGRTALRIDRRLYPITARQLADPRWRAYSAQFYRRRWLIPALTAALAPIAGERSMLDVSIIGYLLSGVLLCLLLGRRFSMPVSVAVSAAFMACWPMRVDTLAPGTDSWGLALLFLSLLLAAAVLRNGLRWLIPFAAAMALLSVTREDGLVLLAAAVWLALRWRDARTLGLAAVALVATLPAALLLGSPLTTALAYVENGYNPPPSTSLSWVISHYWPSLRYTLHSDLTFPQAQGFSAVPSVLWYLGMIVLLVGIVRLLRHRRDDPFFRLIRATIPGAILYILISVNYTNLRLELVFIPALATGLALVVHRWIEPRLIPLRPGADTAPAKSASLTPARSA